MNIHPLALACLIVVLIIAFITDVRLHKIPNWLTYPLIFLAIIAYSDLNGFQGLLFSAEGLGLGLILLMPFHMLGGMGAGDVKLMGAVGAVLGPGHVFYAFMATGIAGGIYASIALLSRAGRLKELPLRLYSTLRTFIAIKDMPSPRLDAERGLKVYFGVAISIGTLAYIVVELYRGNFGTGFKVFM
jgi:prepilin peptidase CpaA